MGGLADVAELLSTRHILLCFVTCQCLILKSDMPWQQSGCLINLISQGVFSKKRGYICLQKGKVGFYRSIRKANILQNGPSVTSDSDSRQEICSALYVKGMHKVPAPFMCMSHICTSLIAQVGRSWGNSSQIHHCKIGSTQKPNTLEKFWVSTCQKELVHAESWRNRRNLMS